VPNFKPDVVAFVGYLIAHDSHHRGQISMLARQVGHPLPGQSGLWAVGVGRDMARLRLHPMSRQFRWLARVAGCPRHLPFVRLFRGRAKRSARRFTWKPLPFAILRFNDEAPNSWNIYHCEKKGLLLVRPLEALPVY